MATPIPLKTLVLEDQEGDAESMIDELRQAGFEPEWWRVQTRDEYLAHLNPTLDIILADQTLPQFDGLTALTLLQERGLQIPFILVSGTISEELAVTAMKQGAADYILKDRMERLGQAVINAVEAKKLRLEKQQLEDLQIESELRYRRLFESAKDGILILDAESGQVDDVNPFLMELLGYAFEDIVGKELWELGAFKDIVASRESFMELQDKGYVRYEDLPLKTHDGRQIDVEFVSNVYLVNDEKVIQCNIRDITERKRAEKAIRFQVHLLDTVGQAVIATDMEANVIYWNHFAETLYGWSAEEALGRSILELTPAETTRQQAEEIMTRLQSGESWSGEFTVQHRDGTTFPSLVTDSPIVNDKGALIGIIGISMDITERKQMEMTLEQERTLLRTLIDSIPDRIYAKDTEGRFTLKNAADVRQMGAASIAEVMGKTDFDYYSSELAARYSTDDQNVIQSGQSLINREEEILNLDGSLGWILTTKVPLRDTQGNVIGLVGVGRDITEHKLAQEKLAKVNRTLMLLSGVNQSIVHVRNIAELFAKVCRIAVEVGGFRMVWIGLLDSETGRVNPVAHEGVAENYLEMLDIVLDDDDPRGQGPSAVAIRTGKPVIVNDIEHDPRMAPWRKDALRLGYCASASFPLNFAGEVRGVLNLYANQTDFFDDEEELDKLSEMEADISFAMEFAENEAHRQQAETLLKQHVQVVEEMRLFLQTTFDAFPANTVVLDPDGTIISVNAGWIRFADGNSAPSPMHYLGANYLTVSDTASGDWSEEAESVADGIRAVIGGSQDEFFMEYPCHSLSEKRWFALKVTCFPEPAPRRVVVAHINITQRRLAEEAEREQRRFAEALRDSLAALTASLDVDTVMHQILENAAQVVPYESASIIQFAGDIARASYLSGYSPEAEAFFKAFQYSKPYPEHLARIEENQSYLIADTLLIADWINIPLTTQVRSSIGVPIIMTDGLQGMLSVDSSTPDRYTPDDVERLKIFARYAAIALENAYHALHLEQKVLERTFELQMSNKRVEAILDNSTDAILFINTDAIIQKSNASFNKLFACERGDYIETSVITLFPDESAEAVIKLLQTVLTDQQGQSIEGHARRKDDTVFDVELGIGYIKAEGMVCTIRDITERKKAEQTIRDSEEKFRLLLDAAPVATVISDPIGRISLVNVQAESLFGFTRAEIVGQMIEVLVPTEARDRHITNRANYMEGPRVRQMGAGIELFAKRKDNSVFPVEIQLSYIQIKDGTMVMSFIVDITERKKSEESLRQTVLREKELNELKTGFVSMATHEFRTPLATIHASTETLSAYRHKLTEDQIEQKLDNIRGQVDYLKDIMDDVLKLAKLEARQVRFAPEMMDFDAFCQDLISEIQDQPDNTHQILYSYDRPDVPLAQMDKKLMRQLISNLLSNAIKYSPENKIITVQLEYTREMLIFSVRDSGIGIPESDIKHLFEPFHRADNVGTIHGTGLGLVIANGSAEMHGGTITVDSHIGLGSTFTVRIPIKAQGE